MKIVALEEHFITDEILELAGAVDPRWRDLSSQFMPPNSVMASRLRDLGDERIRLMDESGVEVQVLSLTTPGVQNLKPDNVRELAQRVNDLVAETVSGRPGRFQGFATLPTPDPAAAARELERSVTRLGLKGAMIFGRTRDRSADAAEFGGIFEAAASLRVPLYLHPQVPDLPVRESYYSGLGAEIDLTLAMGGIGWHYETGVQLLRMILSGVFDRYPDLQVITGHWGEAVLFYLERIDVLSNAAKKLQRPVSEYFRTNVYVTPSGIYSQRYLRWAIEVVGVDRILFSTDFPYVYEGDSSARAFLEGAALSGEDRNKIAHGNWERLCAQRS